MNTIKVFIDWDQNFGAVSDSLPGCVATAQTFEQVLLEYDSAVKFHLEGLENDEIPSEFKGRYKFEYELTAQAILQRFKNRVTRATLSRVTGINERLLGHYLSGFRSPRDEQRKKIVDGLHKLGREFLEIE